MKRHFQCAQQQEAACNFTNCCACHTKWMSPVICHISNVISNARSKWNHPPTSPNATPAIGKWMSPVMCDTYQTSFPMRGASKGSLQPHQILRLPRKMQVIKDLRHICNLISTAWIKQRHPATSPNTAPATQNASHQWSASHMQPHFQCAEQAKAPWNLTKYCACHAKCKSSMICITYATSFPMRGGSKVTVQPHQTLRPPRILKLKISAETPWMLPPIERRFHDNPTTSDDILRYPTRSDDKIAISHPPLPRPYSSHFGRRFCIVTVKYNISRPGYLPKCHEVLRLSRKVTRQPHQILRLPQKVLYELCLYWSVTWLICYFTELFTLRNCYFTDLLLYGSVTLLNCYGTELLLYGTVTLLICYFTDLLLYWSVTLLICYLTELLLYCTVTLLDCYFTGLLLYWTVTLLICYFTDVLLYWSVTLLVCYFTDLLLYWTITLLNCYFTELLLYWSVTLLNYYFTEFLAFSKVRNSEVSHPNFLWWIHLYVETNGIHSFHSILLDFALFLFIPVRFPFHSSSFFFPFESSSFLFIFLFIPFGQERRGVKNQEEWRCVKRNKEECMCFAYNEIQCNYSNFFICIYCI